MSVGIVISVYKENIEYLKNIVDHFTNIYIYLKDETRYEEIKKEYNNENIIIQVLENIGRESQTYLFHMHTYYTMLEDHIYFIQGHPFDHIRTDLLREHITNKTIGPFIGLGNKIFMCDGNGYPHHGGLPITNYFNTISSKNISIYYFYPGAQFIVSKQNIQQHSKEYYLNLDKSHRTIEQLPWILERLWKYILEN